MIKIQSLEGVLLLKFKISLIFLLSFVFLRADEYFIKEPVFNGNLYVNVAGDKNNEAIIFVHGLGDEASSIWKDSIEALKDRYYVVTFDLIGFGKSSKPEAIYSPSNYALLLDFVQKEFVGREFYLVGHSLGGAISLKYATLFGHNIKKMLIIDSAGILHKDAYKNFFIRANAGNIIGEDKNSKLSSVISEAAIKLSDFLPSDIDEIIDPTIKAQVIKTPSAIAALELINEKWFNLDKIETPTMILWGEDDNITPLRSAYLLRSLLKNATLYSIKNSYHVPILDSKNEYLAYLHMFLTTDFKKPVATLPPQSSSTKTLQNINKMTLKDCSLKYLKIIDSKNITLQNCHINRLDIQNSTISINDTLIDSQTSAIYAYNSNLTITSSNINGTINTNSSKFDIAGGVIKTDTPYAIYSSGINEILFSISTIQTTKKNSTYHGRVILKNKESF